MRPRLFHRTLLLLTTALLGAGSLPVRAQSPEAVGQKLFTNHIEPLFATRCRTCHSAGSSQGGLDLTSREALVKGGGRGSAIVPGDAAASLLYKVVAHEADPKMPLQAEKLSPEELGLIATWIDLGAPYLSATPATTVAEATLFEDIQPILETKCLVCHGGKFKQAGLDISTREKLLKGSDEHKDVVVPGNADASLLVKKIRHEQDPGMPYQSDKLPDGDIEKIESWISAKAPYTATLALPAELSERAFSHGQDHWAYQKPIKRTPPTVRNQAWGRHPIDAFIAAEHDNNGLKPLPPTSKRTLVRRVYLDLLGLPPTPRQVSEFLDDRDAQAYEHLIDRLLDSPQYGERWGRHWMDIWRYSDWYGRRSAGDVRNSQPFVWHWRDWIIDSLIADKPYDRMIHEMLAADEIAPTDTDALRATGYLARNWFRFNRNVWVRDTVEYTAAGFLGITMKCARCHDHKFDPIAQEEYYKLRAFFEPHDIRTDRIPGEPNLEKDGLARAYDAEPRESLTEAPFYPGIFEKTYRFIGGNENNPDTEPLDPGVPEILASASNPIEIVPVTLPIESYYPGLRPAIHDDLISEARSEIDRAETALEKARQDVVLAQSEVPSEQKLRHPVTDADRIDFKQHIKPILETHCTSCHSGGSPKSGLSLTSPDAIFAGGNLSGSTVVPGKSADSPLVKFLSGELAPRMPYRQAGLADEKILIIAKWIDQLPSEDPAVSLRRGNDAVAVAERKLEWTKANLPAVKARIAAEKAQYAEPPDPEVEELATKALNAERQAHLLAGRMKLLDAQQRLDEALRAPQPADDDARKAREKQVAAATKRLTQAQEALGKAANEYTPLGKLYPKQSTGRRTALARWITGRDNPLTARVAVNHIWMRHFGEPLVPTVANFGLNGKSPTHPELLDWLAVEFQDSGWSMKHLHRLMLTSNTYRMQSSAGDSGHPSLAADPSNQWYWRTNSRRMEAETVRDSLLHVAGELDTMMGGPELDEAMGETSRRRSLYFTHTPNSQMLFLTLFDGGNAAECYERYESIVPQQALALSNSNLSLSMARLLTARLDEQLEGRGAAAFIDTAFERILARPPTRAEQAMSADFLARQRDLLKDPRQLTTFKAAEKADVPPSSDAATRARENLVHVLLNKNEFVVIR
jgi:mono/diheme cytochrome c family protein